MLIRYSCKDMGLNCPFIVKGESLEKVTQIALEHVREKHSQEFKPIRSAPEVEDMRRALARSTRVVST